MPRPIQIDGANPAAAVQKLLDVAKRGGDIVLNRNKDTGELTVSDGYSPDRPVVVRNADMQTWSLIVRAFRERAGLNLNPNGKTTCQNGVVRAKAKRGERQGAPRFRISIGRSTGRESPTKITIRPAESNAASTIASYGGGRW